MKADLVLRRKGQIDLFADILIDNGNSAVDFCADEVEFYFDVQVSISFIKEAETSIRLETVRNGVWRLSPKRYIIFANPSVSLRNCFSKSLLYEEVQFAEVLMKEAFND
mmetsp:Transcript_37781/g.62650  ORF Transcript_37781/g.62650 Transcript_37781/m.62650 type:complete len:109 (+) Transcript_37781:306-632(+)